ncbi:MAG: dihydroorotase [Oscillospiraceae bacterium]|nr:dihydroorotase [Oscillospiraceae bacterium]
MTILIKNARIIDPAQDWDFLGSLLVQNGVIAALNPESTAADTVIDGRGLVCAPGLVDLHVHLRDPGQTHKEDIASGAAAAAAGGVTTVVAMANTSPVIDCVDALKIGEKARENAAIRVLQAAAVSRGLGTRELADFDALAKNGAAAFSDDGVPFADTNTVEAALQAAMRLDLPLLAHCEDKRLAGDGIINEGEVSRKLGIAGISNQSEALCVQREIDCAKKFAKNAPHGEALPRLHICHVSTKEAVEVIRREKREGAAVTAETAPHYFALCDELLLTQDADYRMNPPLRTKEDVAAIREGLADGTIDCIATDHAPHTPQEKRNFLTAPNGVVGFETSLAAGISYLVDTGVLTLPELIAKMSLNPSRILKASTGTLRISMPADIVIFDEKAKWDVKPENFAGKSRNSAFKGLTLKGKVLYTICDGMIVYSGH